MPNGNLFDNLKSRISRVTDRSDDYEDDYDDYDEYDEYEEYDDYEEEPVRDPYMERSSVTIRGEGGVRRTSLSSATAESRVRPLQTASQRLNSESSNSISFTDRGSSSRTARGRGNDRTMVDSSLPPNMTAEGTASLSARANRRAGGLDALFGSNSLGGSSASSESRLSPSRQSTSSDIIRNSMQLSMPGQRRLEVIKPATYEDAELVTNALKSGDVAVLVFNGVDKQLMKRILDFAFGAASALDASVECIADGVFAICRSIGLDEHEKAELRNMGVL